MKLSQRKINNTKHNNLIKEVKGRIAVTRYGLCVKGYLAVNRKYFGINIG